MAKSKSGGNSQAKISKFLKANMKKIGPQSKSRKTNPLTGKKLPRSTNIG